MDVLSPCFNFQTIYQAANRKSAFHKEVGCGGQIYNPRGNFHGILCTKTYRNRFVLTELLKKARVLSRHRVRIHVINLFGVWSVLRPSTLCSVVEEPSKMTMPLRERRPYTVDRAESRNHRQIRLGVDLSAGIGSQVDCGTEMACSVIDMSSI